METNDCGWWSCNYIKDINVGTSGLVPKIKDGDWVSVRQAIQKLSVKLGPASIPTYAGLTLTGLTTSKLIVSDGDKSLISSDLVSWVTGTANQVIVTDDGDGTITLSTPQDTHVDATPEFAGETIKDSGNNIVMYIDADEFYITEFTLVNPINGNPIGLLLILTYAGL